MRSLASFWESGARKQISKYSLKTGGRLSRRPPVMERSQLNVHPHTDPRLSPAWAPWFSHEYINYYVVNALPPIMDLKPVPVLPDPRAADDPWAAGPRHIDFYKESFEIVRGLNPFESYDYELRNGKFSSSPPLDLSIEPWKILLLYSTEPDLLLDCDLPLDRRQKITGGSHGWRHMEFKVAGVTFGSLVHSWRENTRLARAAFAQGNDYWGWRYLSRATHYLADAGNPFHVKTAPLALRLRKFLSFTELFRIISAAHQGYEIYVERRFREEFPLFHEALRAGAQAYLSDGTGPELQLRAYLQRARKRLNAIFNFIIEKFGQELIGVFGHIDQNGETDVSKQINECSAQAAKIIFSHGDSFSLAPLDEATAEIFFDAGRILASFILEFYRRHERNDHAPRA